MGMPVCLGCDLSVRGGLAASDAAPEDAAIKLELGKAEKDLKKNVYGW
jgi:hypothetical protein